MNAVEVNSLSRSFEVRTQLLSRRVKHVVALDEITFSVRRGELVGLLGPNGAGKTTTIKILTTLLAPTSGHARVLGFDVIDDKYQIRPRIGFVFGGERGLYWRLSAYDNLVYFANLYNVPPTVQKKRIPKLLDLVGLDGRGDEKVQGYSRGMKQRLHIARSLLHDPDVLFLDEPTMGLDPVGARTLREKIKVMRDEQKAILLTTHDMHEAEALCNRIIIINEGKIIAHGTTDELKRYARARSVVEIDVFDVSSNILERIEAIRGVDSVALLEGDDGEVLRVFAERGSSIVAAVVSTLESLGFPVGEVVIREPSLEDAYVRLITRKD